jgi:hypothetical protein
MHLCLQHRLANTFLEKEEHQHYSLMLKSNQEILKRRLYTLLPRRYQCLFEIGKGMGVNLLSESLYSYIILQLYTD